MAAYRYTVRFAREKGCPRAVLDDMARHDRATILNIQTDARCERGAVRAATLLGQLPPTRERWATFVLGTTFENERNTAALPMERYRRAAMGPDALMEMRGEPAEGGGQ